MTKVAVLGGTGMLGSMVVDVLAADPDLEVIATARTKPPEPDLPIEWRHLDVLNATPVSLEKAISGAEWVVNAIGLIKQRIDEKSSALVHDAVKINALFPYGLAEVARGEGARVLQIATDCVYSGSRGNYVERDLHDPNDVYGKTKSLGEVPAENVQHLRCSIVGPERNAPVSLLGWFLSQGRDASLSGFVNHRWNGITTLHFAKVCAGVIKAGEVLPSPLHLVPEDQVTKAELLLTFGRAFGRSDIGVAAVDAPQPIDRTLASDFPVSNADVWRSAGYVDPPSIAQMIDELAKFEEWAQPLPNR